MATLDFNLKYFNLAQNTVLEVDSVPSDNLEIIVVIPAYKEPDIIKALNSLFPSSLSPEYYEIWIILNHPEDATAEILNQTDQSFLDIEIWKNNHPEKGHAVHTFRQILPKKFAGVGLARKIGMDTAAKRFSKINKPEGVIMTYDADCYCSPDHIKKVANYFEDNKSILAASLHYEHPYQMQSDQNTRQQIVDYELHLRAYIAWKKYIGLPYAYHTIGSSMAVRAAAYTRKGGMNKRKAGEDFYFLHKFTHDGCFGEINTTTVFPSCRVSDRVPFGTGRAMQEMKDQKRKMLTYNPKSFLMMARLIDSLKTVYDKRSIERIDLDPILEEYLRSVNYVEEIDSCFQNSASFDSFKKRFFQWLDAFHMMKYLHYMRDHHFPNVVPLASANELLALKKMSKAMTAEDALIALRINH